MLKIKNLILLISISTTLLFGAAAPDYSNLAADCYSILSEKVNFPDPVSKIILDYTEDDFVEAFTLKGHSNEIKIMIALSNNLLVSGDTNGIIKLWDIKNAKCIQTLKDHDAGISALLELPNNLLASGDSMGTIKIWNLETGRCKQTLIQGRQTASSIRVLKLLQNNSLAACCLDNTVKIFEIKTGKCLQMLSHKEAIGAIEQLDMYIDDCAGHFLSLKNGLVASSSIWHQQIKISDINSGKVIKTLEGHNRGVNIIKLLNSNTMISGYSDHTLKVWDINSGECLNTLTHNTHGVTDFVILSQSLVASGLHGEKLVIQSIFFEAPLFPVRSLKCNGYINSLHFHKGYLFAGLHNGDIQVFIHTPSMILNSRRSQLPQVKEKSGCIIC